jgi:hypothetical protein
MMYIITPNKRVNLKSHRHQNAPLFFLGGPILGGGDWQAEMCRIIDAKLKRDWIAVVPCRWSTDHSLHEHIAEVPDAFNRQLDYEVHYLELAGVIRGKSAILFWVEREDVHNPRKDGKQYARDTLGEINRWSGRFIENPSLRFVIGVDPGYADQEGMDIIKRNLEIGTRGKFPFYKSMEETADAAIAMALQK